MPIELKSAIKTLEILNPSGEPVQHVIEYRWDPLTSHISIICPHLAEKWRGFYSTRDEEWLGKTIESSREKCPFCHPLIDEIASRFPPAQMEEEIVKVKDVYIFPNLFPRTAFEAVVTSPLVHSLNLAHPDENILYDFLSASFECIRKAYGKNGSLLYPVIGCNNLPSAGASLMHFHMQISIQEFPFTNLKPLIDASAHYEETNNTNFWRDLIEANEEREIKRKGNLYWHAPFAPEGFCEVRAIIKKPTILKCSEEDIGDLAEGLSHVLKYYDDQGFSAFNFIIYSGRLDGGDRGFLSGLRIIARPNLCPNYLSIDTWYMPLMLGQSIVLEKPEDLAQKVKNYF